MGALETKNDIYLLDVAGCCCLMLLLGVLGQKVSQEVERESGRIFWRAAGEWIVLVSIYIRCLYQ